MSSFSDRPLLFAHRGARTRFPENTLPAFIAAIEDGANALELDVQLTSDGVVVVMHDDDGERMCGVRQMVKDTTWTTVSSWDAGANFVDADGLSIVQLQPIDRGNGHPPQQFIYQPAVDTALREGVDRFPNVSTLLEHECLRVIQHPD